MTADDKIAAPLNEKKLQSVTLFGAIGLRLPEPVYMTGVATSMEEVKRFIPLLARSILSPDSKGKPILIMDGHASHRS